MGIHKDLSKNMTMTYRAQPEDHHITVKSDKEKKFNNTLEHYLKNDPDVVARALEKHNVSFNKEFHLGKHGINVYQFDSITLLVMSLIVCLISATFITNIVGLLLTILVWFSLIIKAIPSFSSEHYKQIEMNLEEFVKEK